MRSDRYIVLGVEALGFLQPTAIAPLDQVEFMRQLVQPNEIVRRIEIYVAEEVHARRLPKGSFEMLREAFFKGEVPRGRASELTGYEERRISPHMKRRPRVSKIKPMSMSRPKAPTSTARKRPAGISAT